ncbi:uncharacterized protein LOC124887817 [Capsicum annuum]|uniref:uncharacterized protein LOC124887817 n=1 Tax=Capsicum annuum TaxID=4072 RepID=UPI001FB194DD|nr:uncharacterized protein LOC124887817 [Capsicum annuum]
MNLLVSDFYPPEATIQLKKKLLHDSHAYIWDEPFLFKQGPGGIICRCIPEAEFIQPILFRDAVAFVKSCDQYQRLGTISMHHEMSLNNILEVKVFDVWGIDFMGPFPPSNDNLYIPVVVDYFAKWVEAEAFPTNDVRVVLKFVKKRIFF